MPSFQRRRYGREPGPRPEGRPKAPLISRRPTPRRAAAELKVTLEALGVVFLPEDKEGGVGIRLKFTESETRRILNWEGEGGRVNQDDVV